MFIPTQQVGQRVLVSSLLKAQTMQEMLFNNSTVMIGKEEHWKFEKIDMPTLALEEDSVAEVALMVVTEVEEVSVDEVDSTVV